MKLTQRTPHLSVKHLPDVELPPFTVLTGVNGAGKTHLLTAIANLSVSNDITDNKEFIKYYDWNELVPSNASRVSLSEVYEHETWLFEQIRAGRQSHSPSLEAALIKYGLDKAYSYDPWRVASCTVDELVASIGDGPAAQAALEEIATISRHVYSHVRQQVQRSNDENKKILWSELDAAKVNVASLTETYYASQPFRWRTRSMFEHTFSRMFLAYFDRVKNNKLRRMDEEAGNASEIHSLSDDEFLAMHGPPPWDFVNETMRLADVDFEIDHPVHYEAPFYEPKLRKISTDTEVQFSALSSGERVLMSFAFCLYYATDARQQIQRPKVLLFDEIDAPLHPSMSRTLIRTIQRSLVEKHGISVVLATHSPSTVAVAPEGSIYLMESGTNRISSQSKRRAVSTLTADIPTMSIDFSGRRQVFVESDFDAARYSVLYQLIAPDLQSERSLIFIGIGRTAQAVTGSAQVVTTVTDLASGGNTSILGLVDWDGTAVATDRIAVLGDGERYAVENFLLDPLIVAAALVGLDPSSATHLGLPVSATFTTLPTLDRSSLQTASDSIQTRVLTRLGLPERTSYVEVHYGPTAGRFTLGVDENYLRVRGHDLEEAIIAEFPRFTPMKGTGKLMMHMIDVVLRNHPAFIPTGLLSTMKWLCEVDIS